MTLVDASPNSDRAAWLERRRRGVGASEVAAVLGISPWSTPYQVWLDKAEGIDIEPTIAMELGLLLEPFVIAKYEEATGLYVGCRQLEAEHPDNPHHIATLDGAAFDSQPGAELGMLEDAVEIVEVKTTSEWSWDEVPDYYYAQAQWQMWCTGARLCRIPVLHDRSGFEMYDVERDEEDIAFMVAAVDRFWTDHVLTGVAPEITGKDLDAVRFRHRTVDPGSILEADEQLVELVRQHEMAKANAKRHDEYIAELTARLVAAVDRAEEVHAPDGTKLLTYKTVREFDLIAAIAERPDLAAECTRPKLDVDAFKKALGRKQTDALMRPSTTRRLYIPTRKDNAA